MTEDDDVESSRSSIAEAGETGDVDLVESPVTSSDAVDALFLSMELRPVDMVDDVEESSSAPSANRRC